MSSQVQAREAQGAEPARDQVSSVVAHDEKI
jgi:hypothetical protein